MSAEFVDVEAPSASVGNAGEVESSTRGTSGGSTPSHDRGVHDASGPGRVVAASAAPEGGGVARHNPTPRRCFACWLLGGRGLVKW